MLTRFRIAGIIMMLAVGPASAHPHVFVSAKAGFHVDENGMLTGLHISWTYDPFTTLFMFDVLDLDADFDGVLIAQDYAAILQGETQWADGYVGDTYLEVDGTVSPHLNPVNAEAVYADDEITVRFDLPLIDHVDVRGKYVKLMLYDPSYYYAYTVIDLIQPSPLPDFCTAELDPFELGGEFTPLAIALSELSRDQTPQQENVGRLFSDEVTLSCG